MDDFFFNQDEAMNADRGGGITEGGVFAVAITKAKRFQKESGSQGIEFAFETDEGQKADFVQVYTKNRDGSNNFARGKIIALMGILGLQKLSLRQNGEDYVYPEFQGKRVAIALQREDYRNNNGELKFKMNLLHFFYADTMQTYREKKENKPPRTVMLPIKDKRFEENTNIDDVFPMTEAAPLHF